MPDRRGPGAGGRRYPRTLRVNELLREVIGEELRTIDDRRLRQATVTAVQADPDLRNALVLMDTLTDEMADALDAHRTQLQAAIARQVRFKRTPRLAFAADPAIESGEKVEAILRTLDLSSDDPDSPEPGDDAVPSPDRPADLDEGSEPTASSGVDHPADEAPVDTMAKAADPEGER